MLNLLIRKLIQGVLMLLVVSAITFVLLSAAGGDALSVLQDNPQISERTIENLRKVYGLDRPLIERYGSWLVNAATGNLGESIAFRIPVSTLVGSRFLNTLMMGVIALTLAISVSLLLAILSVMRGQPIVDTVIEILIFLTASTPRMVLSLLALLLSLSILPRGSAGGAQWFQLIAGSIVLAVPLISIFLAQLVHGLKDVMEEDFIRLARAKGLSEWQVVSRHALRVSLNPFLTVAGLSLGGLLGGSVIVETVLGWQGIGALMVTAVRGRDVPLVMGIVLIASAAVWFGNTLAEFLQAMNDKRIRDGY
ncbi:MAG: ABC transporter permease [Pyrinomonadaceae bacterium]